MTQGRAHWHVAGVGGVGMSALAQALAWDGSRVTGSDRFYDRGEELPIWGQLRGAGVELTRQDGGAIDAGTTALVYSTAIEADNPEMARARELGVPARHRAAVLAELAAGKTVLAVAGTAGKTTTTGMLAHALVRLGADPNVVNGGALSDWLRAGMGVGNARKGAAGAPWVLEVDESDRSLLDFEPEWSVLTNISQDHFGLEEVRRLFREYAGRVKRGVVCGEGVEEVLRGAVREGVALATPPGRLSRGERGRWVVEWRGVRLEVPQPGEHNARNAWCAAELCWRLGYEPGRVAAALADFGGIHRRLERAGDAGDAVAVYDDYAHNPAKIAAAWEAVREAAGGGRVLGVWRPHGYGPLKAMMGLLEETFAGCMAAGDKLWVLPVFDAGGTADRSVSSEDLLARLVGRGVAAEGLPDVGEDSAARVAAAARKGDAVLVMGARDPHLPRFAADVARVANGRG
jgi:UDP-N-acetylmuramate--alanine ligase